MRQTIEGSDISNSIIGGNMRYRNLKQTITATMTLTASMPSLMFIGSAAGNIVLLPPEADGQHIQIVNTGAGTLTVKDDSNTTTILALLTATSATFICNGTTWYVLGISTA
jgi:hypothetical protein